MKYNLQDENARSDEICESYERISSIVYAFFQSHSRVRARIQESVLYGLTSIDKDRCCQLFFWFEANLYMIRFVSDSKATGMVLTVVDC